MPHHSRADPRMSAESNMALPASHERSVGAHERVMLAMAAATCIVLPAFSAMVGIILSLGDPEHSHTFWAVGIGLSAVILGSIQATAILRARTFLRHDRVNITGLLRTRPWVIALTVLAGVAMLVLLTVSVALNLGFVVTAFVVSNFLCVGFPSMTAIGRIHQVNRLHYRKAMPPRTPPFGHYYR